MVRERPNFFPAGGTIATSKRKGTGLATRDDKYNKIVTKQVTQLSNLDESTFNCRKKNRKTTFTETEQLVTSVQTRQT